MSNPSKLRMGSMRPTSSDRELNSSKVLRAPNANSGVSDQQSDIIILDNY